MLKQVLGESGETTEVGEEDRQSHHSDSIMECRRTPRQHAGTHILWLKGISYFYRHIIILTYQVATLTTGIISKIMIPVLLK